MKQIKIIFNQKKKIIILLIFGFIFLLNQLPAYAGFTSIKRIRSGIEKNTRQALKPTFEIHSRYAGAMTSLTFSSERKKFCYRQRNGSAQVWDFATGQRLWNFESDSPVVSTAFALGNRFLAVGMKNGNISLWNLETGEQSKTLSAGTMNALSADKDGQYLITAGNENIIKIWDVQKGISVRNLENGESGAVLSLGISRDGKKLVSVGNNGQIQLRDLQSGEIILTLQSGDKVSAVSFGNNDKYLAAGLENGSIRVWNLESREEFFSKKHNGAVRGISFSPAKSNIFASCSDDKTICLFSLTDKKILQTFTSHNDAVNAVGFTPNWALSHERKQ